MAPDSSATFSHVFPFYKVLLENLVMLALGIKNLHQSISGTPTQKDEGRWVRGLVPS